MEHKKESVDIEKFTWKIENFSFNDVYNLKIYSEPFIVGGYPWRIVLKSYVRKGNYYIAIYLEAMQTANMSDGWRRNVKFKLLLFDQLNTNMTITQEINHEFHASSCERGVEFTTLSDLRDYRKGFLVNCACIIGAEFSVCKATLEKPVNQATSLTVSLASGSQNGHIKGEDPNLETISPVSTHIDAELVSPSIEELMHFSTSVGQLEEVCSDTPSLIESPRDRSQKLTDLAFAAYGRVLYFLKNIKVKDINDKACKDLKVLWDELKKYKFDLTWLEPQVKHALGMKRYVKRAMQVENLKDNIVLLELETERLKAKLAAAKVNLDVERFWLKTRGIKERDLDSKFGVSEF